MASATLSVCYYLLTWDYTYFGENDDMYFGYLYFLCFLLELTPAIAYLFILYRKVGSSEQEAIPSRKGDTLSTSISNEGLATGVFNFRKNGELLGGGGASNSYGGLSSENLGVIGGSNSTRVSPPSVETTSLFPGQNQQRRASGSSLSPFNNKVNDMNSNSGGGLRRLSLNSTSDFETKPLINSGAPADSASGSNNIRMHKSGGAMDIESRGGNGFK